MKLVINVPDYIKEQADDGKGEEFGIPLWLAYEIANGTPLDEIRAEIAEYKDDKVIHAERNEMIDIVLEIIDKYKGESEE